MHSRELSPGVGSLGVTHEQVRVRGPTHPSAFLLMFQSSSTTIAQVHYSIRDAKWKYFKFTFHLHFLDGIILKRASLHQLLGSDVPYIREKQGKKLHSFPFYQILD